MRKRFSYLCVLLGLTGLLPGCGKSDEEERPKTSVNIKNDTPEAQAAKGSPPPVSNMPPPGGPMGGPKKGVR